MRYPMIILCESDTKNIDGSNPFDADKSVRAFEYYIRLLGSRGCKEICVLRSKNGKNVDCSGLCESVSNLLGGRVCTHEEYAECNGLENVNIPERPRIGLAFTYEGKRYMLEVDTLIGTAWFDKLKGAKCYKGRNITHSIGNLGLVPLGSGNKGTQKDYIKYKFCDEGSDIIEVLNDLLGYSLNSRGLYSINDKSSAKDVAKAIVEREDWIICQLCDKS